MINSQQDKDVFVVIMAGGVGSRFWPASRNSQPKQFLDILGTGKSLIQMTYDRSLNLVAPSNMFVMTHANYVDQVAEHLPELPIENIIAEPDRKNTAPCIAYISFHIRAICPNAIVLVLPSDHMINKEIVFVKAIHQAIPFVKEKGGIITLGMQAQYANTGYGYIQLEQETGMESVRVVKAFKEKPDQKTAEAYLAAGNYVWNAGIFMFQVSDILNQYAQYAPGIFQLLDAEDVYGTSLEKAFIDRQYPKVDSISIDYAIMEKSDHIYCMPLDIGWSDLGTWKSLFDLRATDSQAVVSNIEEKNYYIEDAEGLLLQLPKGKRVVVNGVSDMLIIDTDDVLIIWPKEREQEIKEVKEKVAKSWNLD